MACGVHSGDVHVFLTEVPHRELLVAGTAASRVFALEDLAEAGEVVVSEETAARIDPGWLSGPREDGHLLRALERGASPVPSARGSRRAGPRRLRPACVARPPRRGQR